MCTIFRWNGQFDKEVKNLGWLLRHAAEVKNFEVYTADNSYYPKFPPADAVQPVFLYANLADGRIYQTFFQSSAVLREWLHRPRFVGLPLLWLGSNEKC